MTRPDHISLSATARLSGVDVARVYRLARQGKLGAVVHPVKPGQEAQVPVAAVERYALRVFSDADIHEALNPSPFRLAVEEDRSLFPRRRRYSRYGI